MAFDFFFFLFQINIDYQMREATAKKAQDPTHTSFDEVQKTVYVLMERDSYPRFLKSKSYLNLLNQLQTNTSKWSVWSVKSQADCQLSCEEILHGGWILPRKIPVLEGAVRGRCKQLHDQWVQDKSRWGCHKESSTGRKSPPPTCHGVKAGHGKPCLTCTVNTEPCLIPRNCWLPGSAGLTSWALGKDDQVQEKN